jgi:hypothetical protein
MSIASFLYPRTIEIHRPGVVAAPGSANVATLVASYSGETIATETVLFTGIPASIQYKDRDLRPTSPLPADATRPGGWNIYIPLSAGIANGSVAENDIVVDEVGRRYQIEAAYNHPLGWKFHCRFLKA